MGDWHLASQQLPSAQIHTQFFSVTAPGAIAAVAALLQQGQVTIFPTDTVYGVGSNAFQSEAITRLYTVKKRSLDKGIPLLLADLADIDKVALSLPAAARTYIQRFWPGPLTLVVPKRPELPDILSTNANIAVRIPDCDATRTLIRMTGGAVAATSANLSGQPPAQTAVQALDTFHGLVAAILDGGSALQGQSSTVVDCTVDPPRILRAGPITADDLTL